MSWCYFLLLFLFCFFFFLGWVNLTETKTCKSVWWRLIKPYFFSSITFLNFKFFFSKYNFLNNPIFKNLKYNLYYTNPICVQHFWLWVIQLLHKVIGIQFKAGLFLCQFFKFSHTIFLYVKLSPFVKRKVNAREIYVKPISI